MKQDKKEEFPLGLDFFSLFVHELKSPLMSLKFQLENLDSELKEEKYKNLVQKMNSNLTRLFQFVEDGLNMKELEQDFSLNLKWYLWSNILEDIQEQMSSWISYKKIKIVNIDSVPLKVHVDLQWMNIVLKNLLLNAIQHSPESSTIKLQTKIQKDQDLFLSIKDEGKGIPDHLKGKLFHRFQSLRSSSASELKGTGLGLYLSKWIVEKHGGKIELLSSQETGTTFAITLPKACKELLEKAS